MSVRDHYIDFLTIMPDIKASLSAPTLVIHANPGKTNSKLKKKL